MEKIEKDGGIRIKTGHYEDVEYNLYLFEESTVKLEFNGKSIEGHLLFDIYKLGGIPQYIEANYKQFM